VAGRKDVFPHALAIELSGNLIALLVVALPILGALLGEVVKRLIPSRDAKGVEATEINKELWKGTRESFDMARTSQESARASQEKYLEALRSLQRLDSMAKNYIMLQGKYKVALLDNARLHATLDAGRDEPKECK
jgi:hypothetical protein